MDQKNRNLRFSDFTGRIALIQSVSCLSFIYRIRNLYYRKCRKMIHTVKYMCKHCLRRSKRTICNNSFYLLRQIKPACHQYCSAPHRITMQENLNIFSFLSNHPFNPSICIITVLTSESNIFPFTLPMRSLIDKKNIITTLQIII